MSQIESEQNNTTKKNSNLNYAVAGAVIAATALTYWNRNSDMAEANSLCRANASTVSSIRDPKAICDCITNYAASRIGYQHHVPILKNLIQEPDWDRLTDNALKYCGFNK